jgi:hypothetical protein
MAKKLKSGVMKPKPPPAPPGGPPYTHTKSPSPEEHIAYRLSNLLFRGFKQYSIEELYKIFIDEIQDSHESYRDKHFYAALDKLVKDKGVIRKNHPIFGTIYLPTNPNPLMHAISVSSSHLSFPTSKESAAERLRIRIGRVGVCKRCGGSMLGTGRHGRSRRHTQTECDEQMVKKILTT